MGVCALAMELHRKGVCSGTEARLSSVFDLSLKTEASGKNRHHILFSKHLLCSSSLSPAMKMIPFFFFPLLSGMQETKENDQGNEDRKELNISQKHQMVEEKDM